MLFPELRHKKFGYVNLNTEAKRWLEEAKITIDQPNPLLDPDICYQMVHDLHKTEGLHFSYGGWLEDRRDLWRGSYLDHTGGYLHLGIDFNVPVGTGIAVDYEAEVLYVDNDFPAEGGWGNRVIMKYGHKPHIVIYAHLDDEIVCKEGDILSPGDLFARVGASPQNGGWFPHLHVQCVEQSYFDRVVRNDLALLDGYGHMNDLNLLKQQFKDPFTMVTLSS